MTAAASGREPHSVNSGGDAAGEGPEELRERLQERRRGRHGGLLLWVVDRNGDEPGPPAAAR